MANLTTVRLNRGDSPNWGFRLQGGKDFGTPLVIQKVNGGSPAERAGLIAGDAVIKINNVDVYNLLHKEAQDVIVRSGSSFDMVIQRGGSTWKPSVVPAGTVPKPSPVINNFSPVTKTSLAATKGENIGAIGTGHNLSAKPFGAQVNGAVNGGPKLVNKQYNSPLKLYSEDAIAESLSAQTEVLSTGALGVNFKKNEKDYDASNSAVYRMLQEAENDPTNNEPVTRSDYYSSHSHAIGGRKTTSPRPSTPSEGNTQKLSSTTEGATICTDCERVIVGVFVRIKDKNLHVECFKCATCGSSLKNVGYYNINNKLYCDIHAKAAAIAINNPSAIPVTIPPGGKAPASAISAALSGHTYPTSSPLSPKAPSYAPSYQPSNFSGPKPFSSVSAPLSPGGSLHRAAPLSPQGNYNRAPLSPSAPSYGSYSPSSTAGRSTNITWPPTHEDPEVPTACPLFYPPPSKVEAELEKKLSAKKQVKSESDYFAEESEMMDETMSFYSEELCFSGRRSAAECTEILSEALETQKLVENVVKASPQLVLPPLQSNEISKQESHSETNGISLAQVTLQNTDNQKTTSCELKRPVQYTPNTIECQLPNKVENTVPQKWESSLTQAVRTVAPDADTFSRIPTRRAISPMVSALIIAPAQPFNPLTYGTLEPVPLPEETEPYFPPEHPIIPTKIQDKEMDEKPPVPKPKSPFIKALEIAPDRPFIPVGGCAAAPPVKKKPKDPLDKLIDELPKPSEKLDMRSALTTAPERSYTPHMPEYFSSSEAKSKNQRAERIDRSQLIKPLKPDELPESFKINIKEPKPPSYYAPVLIEEQIKAQMQASTETVENKETKIVEREIIQPVQISQPIVSNINETQPVNFAPIFQGFTCSFKNKTDHSQFSVEVCTTPPVPTPPPKPQTPISYIATVEQKPGTITREKIVQETLGLSQSTKREENIKHELKANKPQFEVQKQAEEVIQVKPLPVTTILHKAEALPSYQVDLQATAESELRIMEKKRKAEERLEQQKREREQEAAKEKKIEQTSQPVQQINKQTQQQQNQQSTQQRLQDHIVYQHQLLQQQSVKQVPPKPERHLTTKPIITVEPGDTNNIVEKVNFQPVTYEKPASTTFSPRPRSMTPSMINKAPPILPYYQDNLVAHFHAPVEANILDPTTPDISRSPSPHPEMRSRSPSPFPSKAKQDRAKSPAQGPPPNPLHSSKPLPTPQDSRIQQAKDSLKTFLPEYKCHRDLIEQRKGVDFYKKDDEFHENGLPQVNQNVTYSVTGYQNQLDTQMNNVQCQVQSSVKQQFQAADSQKHEIKMSKNSSERLDIYENSHREQLAASRQSESKSSEISADGLTHVQKRKVITEEYEQAHKETNIQINKNVTSAKYPFTKVNVPTEEPPIVQSFHVTNPHHGLLPFKTKQAFVSQQQLTQKSDTQTTLQQASEKLTETCQNKVCKSTDIQAQPQPVQNLISQPQNLPSKPPTRHVFAPGSLAPIKHVTPPGACQKPSQNVTKPTVPKPNVGAGTGRQSGGITAAPKRGRGLLNTAALPGARVPLCGHCHGQIRGPFITALGKIWCPGHFVCATPSCKRPLQDLGFVEEKGQLYCEYCFEQYLAPPCSKCNGKIKGDCLKAIGKNFHPECFTCVYCGKLFGNSPFFLEDGNPYCEADWNELFTTKCYACGFPVEAGDRWVEALNNNYHSQCFNCTMCKKNLEGQSFFAKGGRPFCKNHAR